MHFVEFRRIDRFHLEKINTQVTSIYLCCMLHSRQRNAIDPPRVLPDAFRQIPEEGVRHEDLRLVKLCREPELAPTY